MPSKCSGLASMCSSRLSTKPSCDEGADPFVRLDEHVRPLADAVHAQKLQGVVVEVGSRALRDLDLDPHVRAFRLERGVEPLGGLLDVARAQRPGRVLARPELVGDLLGRDRRRASVRQAR